MMLQLTVGPPSECCVLHATTMLKPNNCANITYISSTLDGDVRACTAAIKQESRSGSAPLLVLVDVFEAEVRAEVDDLEVGGQALYDVLGGGVRQAAEDGVDLGKVNVVDFDQGGNVGGGHQVGEHVGEFLRTLVCVRTTYVSGSTVSLLKAEECLTP